MGADNRRGNVRACASLVEGGRFTVHLLSGFVALACALALAVSWVAPSVGSAYAEDGDQVELATTSDAAGGAQSDADAVQPDADGAVVVEGAVVEDEAAQIDDDAVPLSSGEDAAATEAESIEDEDNPMSSGLENQRGPAGGIPLYGLIMVMIAAVVAFFASSTRKVNTSIAAMNRKIR